MKNYFDEVLDSFNENDINYEIEETENEYAVYFNLDILNKETLCVLEHDYENEMTRFYFEFLEYEENEDSIDAESFCNIFNYNSTFLKAYIDERNVVCFEYYFISNKENILTIFDALVSDIFENEETMQLYLEEEIDA